ncbi:hypothetical protein FBZ88_11682 [Nitrospirillum bahiense]|uniref:Uncharacterized protein n=1 Tax=Nitrospirillum amazonense TaxID=28077 RepID=A0A560FKX1_9PROT|nr:hypothetical protein FBZ88_11682 [Nitrospirillum amazonense]
MGNPAAPIAAGRELAVDSALRHGLGLPVIVQ